MKIAYLCSEDDLNSIFVETIKKYNVELNVFIENNTNNKKNIIKKKLQNSNIFKKLFFPFDVLSLYIYKYIIKRYINKKLSFKSSFGSEDYIFRTKDINSIDVFNKISNFRPDIIIIRGTTIIKEPLISYNTQYFLNIHGAVVPNYRNVHGQFWSFYFKDFDNMGSSVLHLTKGIDNGNVALMEKLNEKPLNLRDLHVKTIILSNKLIDKIISTYLKENIIQSTIQNQLTTSFYGTTPTFLNFIQLFIKRNK
tara:strand:+ start:1312 stop:2067 length:756 start_codon:yes stop_codon:yes gene_type:complete